MTSVFFILIVNEQMRMLFAECYQGYEQPGRSHPHKVDHR